MPTYDERHPPVPSIVFGKVTAQAPQPGGAQSGIPDRGGSREADEGGPEYRPARPPGCDTDPDCLPPCPAGRRAGGSALGADRPQPGIAACGTPEERGGLLTPATRAGDTCPAAATAGLSGDTLRLRHRAQGAADRLHGAQAGGEGRGEGRNRLPGPSAHAPSRVWLQAGQRWS